MNPIPFISSMMSQDNGNPSSMRSVLVFGVIVIVGAWAFICFSSRTLVPFDTTHITVLGMLLAGKVVQKSQEEKTGEKKQ